MAPEGNVCSFLFRRRYFWKRCQNVPPLGLAPCFTSLYIPIPRQAQASENKSIGWNSPRDIFGSSLGNGGTAVNWIWEHEGNRSRAGRRGCSCYPWIRGEAVGSEGIPGISPGRKHPLSDWWVALPGPSAWAFAFLSQRFGFAPGLLCLPAAIFGSRGWSPPAKGISSRVGCGTLGLGWLPF